VDDTKKPNGKASESLATKEANIEGESGDDSEEDAGAAGGDATAAKKKKKRKPRKKKAKPKVQSDPPRVDISNFFPANAYPEGEISEYTMDTNTYRTTSEEKRHLDRMSHDTYNDFRRGAEVHRQVRQWAQKNIKPGQSLTEIAEGIEDSVRALTGHQGLEEGDSIKGGMGFPTGLSINNCAAHYTPNAGNKVILQEDDVMKVDFGVHINGRIVDSAFTWTANPVYDNLLAAVKEATNTGVKVSCNPLEPYFII
jgi:methionyl aminopeptidase